MNIRNDYAKILTVSLALLMIILIFFVNTLPISNSTTNMSSASLQSRMGPSVEYITAYLGTTDTTEYEWGMVGRNASRNWFSPMPTAPSTPHRLWETRIHGGTRGMAEVVANGKVICTVAVRWNGNYALDQNTGKILWYRPGGGTPFMLDDTHLLLGRDCVDPETGTLLWQSPVYWMPVYVPEIKMGFAGGPTTGYGGQTLAAWDFSDLSKPPVLAWQSDVFESIGAKCYWNGRVYAGGSYAFCDLYCFDVNTGTLLWEKIMPNDIWYNVGVAYGRLYFGALSIDICCYDAETGNTIWKQRGLSGELGVSTSFAMAYDRFYVGEIRGNLYCFDANDGHVVWKYRAVSKGPHLSGVNTIWHEASANDASLSSSTWDTASGDAGPAVAAGKVYACTKEHTNYPTLYPDGMVGIGGPDTESEFTCFDAFTGRVLWKDNAECHQPTLADGKVIVPNTSLRIQGHLPSAGLYPAVSIYPYNDAHGNDIICYGAGPTSLTMSTDKTTVKLGETIKISGSLNDLSPASPGAAAPNVPLTLSYREEDGSLHTIASLITDKDGKFTCDWTPPHASLLPIVASSPGSDAYIAPEDAIIPVQIESPILVITLVSIIAVTTIVLTVIYVRKKKSDRGVTIP
jgi:outer membrane protein assembly factor BamB